MVHLERGELLVSQSHARQSSKNYFDLDALLDHTRLLRFVCLVEAVECGFSSLHWQCFAVFNSHTLPSLLHMLLWSVKKQKRKRWQNKTVLMLVMLRDPKETKDSQWKQTASFWSTKYCYIIIHWSLPSLLWHLSRTMMPILFFFFFNANYSSIFVEKILGNSFLSISTPWGGESEYLEKKSCEF